jgi:hypothetical protein
MRGHEKDPRRNPGAFYGLDRFRQARTCPGRWRKLRERGRLPQRAQSTANQECGRYPEEQSLQVTSTTKWIGLLTFNRELSTVN